MKQNEELKACPFECDGLAKYQEDDYNQGYVCEKCEGWFMPCAKPLRHQPKQPSGALDLLL